jgi:hypothetical protein
MLPLPITLSVMDAENLAQLSRGSVPFGDIHTYKTGRTSRLRLKNFYTACARVDILRKEDSIRHYRLTPTAAVVYCVVKFTVQRFISYEFSTPAP